MRAVNALAKNARLSARTGDNLFLLSIRGIVDNILLREMKNVKEIKTIAIISPFCNDGKSEISNHLAYELAARGSKTLLFSIQRTQEVACDISEPLQSYTLLEENIFKTGTKNLDYLSLDDIRKGYGHTLDKSVLCNLLAYLKSKYKRIIIDTGSLDKDLSGFMAASAADGVYFICSRSNIRRGQMEKYYRSLKDIGANILGIIYNNAEQKTVEKVYVQNGEKHG